MFQFLPEGRFLTEFEVPGSPFETGGFGSVYKCKNKLDLQTYAVKVVEIPADSKEKILREVQLLASVEDIHIVRYYQAWIEDGYILSDSDSDSSESEEDIGVGGARAGIGLILESDIEKKVIPLLLIQMELCSGTLTEKLQSVRDPETAWQWFREIMEGLLHLHSFGIIHNDLTRDNIFLDQKNHVKIGDLGLAKELRGVSTISTEGSLGMYLYRAPEKAIGVQIDPKADIFSAGIIFYELLKPFGTGHERWCDLERVRKGEISIDGYLEIVELVKKMVCHCPNERPSASEVLSQLELPALKDEFKIYFALKHSGI